MSEELFQLLLNFRESRNQTIFSLVSLASCLEKMNHCESVSSVFSIMQDLILECSECENLFIDRVFRDSSDFSKFGILEKS